MNQTSSSETKPLFPALYGKAPVIAGGIALFIASVFLLNIDKMEVTLLGKTLGFPPGDLFVNRSSINGVDEGLVYRDTKGVLRINRVGEKWVEHALQSDSSTIQDNFSKSAVQQVKGFPPHRDRGFPLVSAMRSFQIDAPSSVSFRVSPSDVAFNHTSAHLSGSVTPPVTAAHISGYEVKTSPLKRKGNSFQLTHTNSIQVMVFDKASLPAGVQNLHNFYTELSAYLGLVADEVVYSDYQIVTGTSAHIPRVHYKEGDAPFDVASWHLFCDAGTAYVFFSANWSPQTEASQEDFSKILAAASSLHVVKPQ